MSTRTGRSAQLQGRAPAPARALLMTYDVQGRVGRARGPAPTSLQSFLHGPSGYGLPAVVFRFVLNATVAVVVSGPLFSPALWAQEEPQVGKRSDEIKACDRLFDHGKRPEARDCYSRLLATSKDPGTQAEAAWQLHDKHRANEAFRAALQARPKDPYLRVRWGYLFLETYQPGEAAKLFKEALDIQEDYAPAKLGAAAVVADRFEGKALELAKEALETDPNLVDAYVLMAGMAIEEGDLDQAEQYLNDGLRKAEELGESPLELYSLKASADLLKGNVETEWIGKALAYNPAYGQIFADAAHYHVMTRRYREAAALLRQAVRTDPELWSAHADLAVNLMRLGKEEEGRRHLEIAYNGDPFSPKTVNTLRLLDSFDNFERHSNKDNVVLGTEEQIEASLEKPEVILRLHKEEAAYLRPYVMEVAEQSIGTFAKKYRFRLKEPVLIELYPDHDDFAVRTMGMPGIGLLGVTFGYLIAMDSPSGRPPGQFHWGTTLWHEIAHVFTLEATNHLVPRWYSEGLSMFEEWEARPSWGENISTDFVDAIKKEKLLPIAELDKGFVRPRYPSQIAVSYFQSGLVCKMIAEQWEFTKLVDLLEGFRDGRSTAENIEAELGVAPEEFDKRFADYLQEQYGDLIEGFGDWRKLMKEAVAAIRKKNWDEVIEPATKAQEIYPWFVEGGNPYVLLARAYVEKEDRAAAAEQMQEYQRMGGRSPKAIRDLAGWLEELGRRDEAIDALNGLLYIAPGDAELHSRLGEWLLEAGRDREALREFETYLAMGPLDLAGAHFNLARAYHKMEDRAKTRKHVLAALEAAPNFRPAQKLLLTILD